MYALLNRYKRKQAFFTEKKACFSLYLFEVDYFFASVSFTKS